MLGISVLAVLLLAVSGVLSGKTTTTTTAKSTTTKKPKPSGHSKRDGEWWQSAKCRDGYTACGVYGGNRKAWECIDTKYDLESCGGCAVLLHSQSPRGVDCTAIPGVADVGCDSGECDVRSCKAGWAVSPSGTSCVKAHHNTEGEEPMAAAYGLEHHPLAA